MKKVINIYGMLLLFFSVKGQTHLDYVGAGHSEGITITSSSYIQGGEPSNVIDGSGMDAKAMEASRFLAQATLGYDMDMINALKEDLNFEAWLDNQMQIAPSSMLDKTLSVWEDVLALHVEAGEDPEEVFGPYTLHFNYAWWELNMTNEDILRQRIAFALSQIFVISMNSDLSGHIDGVASFYDILVNNAFGNFEDMLLQITLHPAMGYYLSHLNNPKEDAENNIHPDENYAREIMQLFSIGLYELNQDGSRKKDQNGNDIPTYDNSNIKEFAQVFTGLGPGDINDMVDWTNEPYFGLSIYGAEMTTPMKMYDFFHETDEKELLNSFVIPANNPGMLDIELAVNHLFNHENVGPFLALRLIQRLIKSNPTPQYISRVASVFNDNGEGVRGDMMAVVKAIFLDPEARDCAPQIEVTHGRLREPVVRLMQYSKSLPLDSPSGRFWHNGYETLERFKQFPMNSPTVFNFYNYDHAPVGELSNSGLLAPEFKIHDTGTSINYINKSYQWNYWDALWWSWHYDYGVENVGILTDDLEDMAEHKETIINHMDIMYTHGQLTDRTRQYLRDGVDLNTWDEWGVTRTLLYLLQISPDYNIVK